MLQVGTPQQVYDRPANRFVAEFLGEINMLPLKDVRQEDGLGHEGSPGGSVRAEPARGGGPARPGGPYDVSQAPAGVTRLDLGSLKIPSVSGVEVRVLLLNTDRSEPFEVAVGDRIAQLVVVRHEAGGAEEVDSLEATARGAGGFGSTGIG